MPPVEIPVHILVFIVLLVVVKLQAAGAHSGIGVPSESVGPPVKLAAFNCVEAYTTIMSQFFVGLGNGVDAPLEKSFSKY